jgi:hypothetical protein
MKQFFQGRKHIPILTYLSSLALYFAYPLHALAARPYECNGGKGIETALGCMNVDTEGFAGQLLGFLAGIAGAIALIIMLMATVQIMTGGDNAEQVKKGKELFTSAITGLLFIIFSVTLLKIVAGDIIQLPGFAGP